MMKTFIFRSLFVFLASSLFIPFIIQAQFRGYNIVYADNAKGSIAIFGNTLMNIVDNNAVNVAKMNDNSANGNSIYGNDNENMQYVDVDGNTGSGSLTRNSSTSDLILPAGVNTIKFARLYWGGRVKTSDFDLTQAANKKIKIRKGTLAFYSEFTASQMDKNIFIQTGEQYVRYQAFADVTSFIQNNGAGTYSIGNVPLSTGAINNGGNYGGWCIVVVYENPSLNYSSIRLYDGFEQIFNNGNPQTTSITLTGLNVPSGALATTDAKMGVVIWEGDANLVGDFLKINDSTFSNGINQFNNPWNGTISNNGVHVTTKNPNYTNQMGIDIDQFDIGTGYGLMPNATGAVLQFGTEADQYFPGIFSFVIKMKDPAIILDKYVADANNDMTAEVGEVLTYTLKGKNIGTGNANKVVVTDTLPNTVTYVSNSLKVISCPGITPGIQTDATADDVAEYMVNGTTKTVRFRLGTGANATDSGMLAPNQTYEVEFKVTVNDPGAGQLVPAIINTARVKAKSDANVDFVDDGTAIINPQAGALAVTFIYINASLLQNNNAQISWATSMEINCSYYDVERSFDGNAFTGIATLQGNGTTTSQHNYSIVNDIAAVTSPIIYYRLKQVDVDGKKYYSKVIALRLNKETRPLLVSPNPFKNYFNINVDWNKNETAMLKILDVAGKEFVAKNISLTKGYNYIKVDEVQLLLPGNYIVQIISSDKKISQKIIKEQ